MTFDTSIPLRLEEVRRFVNRQTDRNARSEVGQFLTPAPIACFMASLFQNPCRHVRILDPGAGAGALFGALVQEMTRRQPKPESIEVVAYETDKSLEPSLEESLRLCREACRQRGVRFAGTVLTHDFVSSAVAATENGLFTGNAPLFTHAILNPPYKKIGVDSLARKALSSVGLETSNLYSAFVWLSARLLEFGGEIAAITPRSFCNGPYFRPYRKALLDLVGLRRIHVFQSRSEAFGDDSVLQENVIFHGIRGHSQPAHLAVSVSRGRDFSQCVLRQLPFDSVILPGDVDAFIHLAEDDAAQAIMEKAEVFHTTLDGIGLAVSTGRVVDFRTRDFLRAGPEAGTVPVLYPCHFLKGFTQWPLPHGKKPNAIALTDETMDLLVERGCYVLVKRFSSKEERRRIVAAVCEPTRFETQWFGFENHLNYFHAQGGGLLPNLAKGLALFLNSSLLDKLFRIFSGHTQVNASDLRKLRYPTRDQLLRMGGHVKCQMPDQQTIDEILNRECRIDG